MFDTLDCVNELHSEELVHLHGNAHKKKLIPYAHLRRGTKQRRCHKAQSINECHEIVYELQGNQWFFDKSQITADIFCPVVPAAAKPQPEILSSLQTVCRHAVENHLSYAQWVFTTAVNSLLTCAATMTFTSLP